MKTSNPFERGLLAKNLAAHTLLVSGLFLSAAWMRAAETSVQAWVQRYSQVSDSDDNAQNVVTDNAGNVIVAGLTGDGITGTHMLVIKHSGAGVPSWTNRYNGSGNGYDFASAVAVDGSGNVFVTGSSASDGSGIDSDYATIAYSGAGVPLWTNRYNGPGNQYDDANAVAVDGSGNVFVTGSSYGNGSSSDYATIKYSGAGVPLWTNRYNGPGNTDDHASAVAVDGSGNVFVTGYSYGSGGGSDYATIKYSGAGVPLWTNRYNGPANGDDFAQGVAVDDSGNVFVTGSSHSGFTYDYVTIAYSSAGVPLWTNRYANGEARAVAVDGNGNVFVTGPSATIKYSGAGVPLWTNRYDGPGNGYDYVGGLALGPDGSVYVTGTSAGDFATIKYISVPLLAIERSATAVLVSWPSAFGDFILQQNTSGIATMNWSNVIDPIQNDGTNRALIVDPPIGSRFYRLFKP